MDWKKPPTATGIDDDPAHRDPVTGAPGSHPLGTGAGAATGGLSGAVIGGALGGPIGAAVGTVVGGVAGGLAGKGIAERVNPTVEHDYWRRTYVTKPYVEKGEAYERYAPAYQYGWESYYAFQPLGMTFEEVEEDLAQEWPNVRGTSTLDWERAKNATRDAWQRSARSEGCV